MAKEIQVKYQPEDGDGFLDFYQDGNMVSFNDDEIMINLKRKERDYDILIDICQDMSGGLIAATGADLYRAQIFIPARQYVDKEIDNPDYDPDDETSQKTIMTREAVPFDISRCILTLWAKED